MKSVVGIGEHRTFVVAMYFLLAAWLPLLPVSAQAAERYEKAAIDGKGKLRFIVAKHGERRPKKARDQVRFDAATISDDGTTVGWLALYPNCCTSYPIPLALVIYRNGKIIRRFDGNGMAIWVWQFEAGGRQVAFEQETVHGHAGVHYELRDIDSGSLLAEYDGDPAEDAPDWVRDVTR